MIWLLFPGQGSQEPGMGRDYYEASPHARAVLDEADAILGKGFLDRIFSGPDHELRDTRAAHGRRTPVLR